MRRKKFALLTAFGVMMVAAPAFAQPYIFPNSGQSAEQQAKDRGSCESWAKQQTGFDPMMASSAPPSSSNSRGPTAVRGAARGAAAGAAMGAIAGDAGKGAAMGAAGGAMMGGMRRRDQRRQEDAQRQDWEAQQQAAREQYMRAFSACMEGKGYTVK